MDDALQILLSLIHYTPTQTSHTRLIKRLLVPIPVWLILKIFIAWLLYVPNVGMETGKIIIPIKFSCIKLSPIKQVPTSSRTSRHTTSQTKRNTNCQ